MSSLSALGTTQKNKHFSNVIDGVCGSFSTSAGTVCYLQTKAKIGRDSSKYSQLTKHLVPAREALNVEMMDFNQLLQRDLDDHRIVTKLIPYILNPPKNSLAGFYPPIVAVILPFNEKQEPTEHFPELVTTIDSDVEYDGLNFIMHTHGDAYRVQKACDLSGKELELPLSVLRWNPETAKLVIMDGQHRAMSLLAIERTVTNTWGTVPKGASYAPFYEQQVKKLISEKNNQGEEFDLKNIELPVTICWFPEAATERKLRPHTLARKIFVDVNNTAKPPSAARLVLLSDTQLDNIFARELLNQLRKDSLWSSKFPLYSVEYDNPDKASTRPKRWSAITSLDILKEAVVKSVFGPPKIIQNPSGASQGKPPRLDMDKFMRSQLEIDKIFTKEFEDGPRKLLRENIGNEVFPIYDQSKFNALLKSFYDRYGQGILHLLSEVFPYKMHLQALTDLHKTWTPSDTVSTLAKNALFEGTGMLWTIENGHKLWSDECTDCKKHKKPEPPQTDISKSWHIISSEQKNNFRNSRSNYYLGSSDTVDLEDTNEVFDTLITYAAQIGLILSWITVSSFVSSETSNPSDLASSIAEMINKSLVAGPNKSRNRKRIFLKRSKVPGFVNLNGIPKLDTPYFVHLRYLWLELLLVEENRSSLANIGVDLELADDFLNKARKQYIEFLIKDRENERSSSPEVKSLPYAEQAAKARELALAEIVDEQIKAQEYWFGHKKAVAQQIIEGSLATKINEQAADSIQSSEDLVASDDFMDTDIQDSN